MVKRTLHDAISESTQITSEQMNWITDMFTWQAREQPTNEARALEELLIDMVDALTQRRALEEASANDYDNGYDDGYRASTRAHAS